MVPTIVPYLPQLIQSTTQQSAPPTAFLQMESPVAPNRETQLEAEPPLRQAADAHAASLTTTPAQSQSRSCDPKEVLNSKGEIGESSKGGSPFTPEIQGKPIPASFRLPTLELYDGGGDPTEHIVAFHTQMALYDTFDALICRAFPTTLRRSASTCIKSKTSSDTGTCVGMSTTNPHFSLANLLEIHCPDPKKLGLTDKDLVTLTSTLTGFTEDFVSPMGAATIPVTFGGEPR
ncbi:hypothetical protein BHE74_00057925 [Ensete ventricosum]|nr:hypothetical protein BHE74_00057925 [Ensete ventricosum]